MHFGRMCQLLETETPQVLILTKLATVRGSQLHDRISGYKWRGGVGAANALVLECLLLMGRSWPDRALGTLGVLRSWLGGGKGMSPSAATEPHCCLMPCPSLQCLQLLL